MESKDVMDGIARAAHVWAKMGNNPKTVNIEKAKKSLKKAAYAITQLWRDLEEEERAGVGRKALA